MSAAERSTTAEIAECTTLFDLDADLGLAASVVLAEKAATLARYAVSGLMRQAEHSEINGSDLHLIEDIIYAAENHAGMARKRLDEATPTVGVHPPVNELVTHGTRLADCPACGAAIIGESVQCDRCDTRLHAECYFGRVATLEEWQDYIRNVNGGPEDFAPTVVCAQCRAKGDPA